MTRVVHVSVLFFALVSFAARLVREDGSADLADLP